MTETPSEVNAIGTFEFKPATDKRGRPYCLITVSVGNVTSMSTSTDPDTAATKAIASLRELTGETGELIYRCVSDTDEGQEWEVATLGEAA